MSWGNWGPLTSVHALPVSHLQRSQWCSGEATSRGATGRAAEESWLCGWDRAGIPNIRCREKDKLLSITDDYHHPLHSTFTREACSVLLSLTCSTNRRRKSFVPRALQLFNSTQTCSSWHCLYAATSLTHTQLLGYISLCASKWLWTFMWIKPYFLSFNNSL